MLILGQLRQEAYWAWEELCAVKGVFLGAPGSDDLPEAEAERLPWTNETFKDEVRRQFGDLRRRTTWEAAAIYFTAHSMVQSYMEPYMIVGFMASPQYMTSAVREAYGERVIAQMLQFPEIVDIVKRGLEQLYYESDRAEDREMAQVFLKEVTLQLPGVALALEAA